MVTGPQTADSLLGRPPGESLGGYAAVFRVGLAAAVPHLLPPRAARRSLGVVVLGRLSTLGGWGDRDHDGLIVWWGW